MAIAPFAVDEGDTAWLGPALVDALWVRLHNAGVVQLSPRQVRAAARQIGLNDARLARPTGAAELGRQLGAAVTVSGEVRATEGLVATLRLIDVASEAQVAQRLIKTPAGAWLELERKVAQAVFEMLGQKPPPEPGIGTRNAEAWEAAARGTDMVARQSFSPNAADGAAAVRLSEGELEVLAGFAATAVKRDKSFLRGQILAAMPKLLSEKPDDGVKALLRLEKQKPTRDPMWVLALSFGLMRTGRYDEAEKRLRADVAQKPAALHTRATLGQLLTRFGRFREARAAFTAYGELAPKNPWVIAQIAYANAKLGKAKEAVEQTQRAVELSPDSPLLWIELASRQIDAKDLAAATTSLQTAISLDPEAGAAYVRLGYVQLLQNDDPGCVASSLSALEKMGTPQGNRERRDVGYAHVNLARALGHQGKLDEALTHLGTAKELGMSDFSEVEGDAKLEALRAHAGFAKLLE